MIHAFEEERRPVRGGLRWVAAVLLLAGCLLAGCTGDGAPDGNGEATGGPGPPQIREERPVPSTRPETPEVPSPDAEPAPAEPASAESVSEEPPADAPDGESEG